MQVLVEVFLKNYSKVSEEKFVFHGAKYSYVNRKCLKLHALLNNQNIHKNKAVGTKTAQTVVVD